MEDGRSVARVDLVCPACHGVLSVSAIVLTCASCRCAYPVDDRIADFSGRKYFDDHPDPASLSEEARRGYENENAGRRIEDYYLPVLRATGARSVLDSGCGNGEAIDLLTEAGFEAWGHDLSAFRKWQWQTRDRRDRLVVADGLRLPFPNGSFDAVICSGVLEHIGVDERGAPGVYEVSPLGDRDARRAAFVGGLVRVLAPGGVLFLDFPNGAFPIDFWHGPSAGGARWHSPFEGFLPKVKEIAALVRSLEPACRVRVRSPHRRLRFNQVAGHWYGRLFRSPMKAFFALMSVPGFGWLAGTALNPYLVLEIRCR